MFASINTNAIIIIITIIHLEDIHKSKNKSTSEGYWIENGGQSGPETYL